MKTLVIAASIALSAVGSAQAAEFQYFNKGYAMVMTGDIIPGDDQRFASAYTGLCQHFGYCPERMFLNSPGGQIGAGFDLGRMVEKAGLDAVVGKTDQCYSSCVIVFAARHRALFSSSRIGVHNATGDYTVTLEVAKYMLMLGTPRSVVDKMLATPNNDIAMLDWNDIYGWSDVIGYGDQDGVTERPNYRAPVVTAKPNTHTARRKRSGCQFGNHGNTPSRAFQC